MNPRGSHSNNFAMIAFVDHDSFLVLSMWLHSNKYICMPSYLASKLISTDLNLVLHGNVLIAAYMALGDLITTSLSTTIAT